MNMINEIISKKKINEKNNELASLINSNESKDIVILGVMNGSFYFMKDLMDKLKIDFKYDFLFCSSYFGETKSSGKVDFIYPNKVDISDKDVFVLEDIIDTGRTIIEIKKRLEDYGPRSINFCSLLIRDSFKSKINIFWTGYKIKNEFVVGYGLDYKGEYRNLDHI